MIYTTLSGKAQFEAVYDKGVSRAAKEIVIKALPNGLGLTRYGITISRRIGKAVVRNKIKRRLREILRKIDLPLGWDIVIIARNPSANADYTALGNSVGKLLKQAGLFVGENESNRSGVD